MEKIILAKYGGYCEGVRHAVKKAFQNAKNNTYILGKLIHNEFILEKLKENGIKHIDNINQFKDGLLLFCAHGVGKSIYDECYKRNINYIDCTCKFVKKIHNLVFDYFCNGYKIYIIGDKEHAEVKGINGWCNNEAIIIQNETDCNNLNLSEKNCVVCQTTYDYKQMLKIKNIFLNNNDKIVEFFDTICYTTKVRQNESESIAKQCDLVIILGSKLSSNTKRLQNVCQKYCSTYLINNLNELIGINFDNNKYIGIVAGASTSDHLITEVYNYMVSKVGKNLTDAEDKEFLKAVDKKIIKKNSKNKKLIKSKVIFANEKGIFITTLTKQDGFVPKNEISDDYNAEKFVADQEIQVVEMNKKDIDSGCMMYSIKQAEKIKQLDTYVEKLREGEPFTFSFKKDTKGGLIGKKGSYIIFLPISHIQEKSTPNLKNYLNKPINLLPIDIDENRHKIVVSAKKYNQIEREEREKIFWQNIKPNVVVSGVVKRFAPFGAFVSVDGFDCLAHINDIAWTRDTKLEEILEIGKTYDFVVLSVDQSKGKVSLGYKQLQPNPFEQFLKNHKKGDIVECTVIKILPFGALLEIEKNVNGLLHVSEFSNSYVKNISDVIKLGDKIKSKIIFIDKEKQKISLSAKAALQPEENGIVEEELHNYVEEEEINSTPMAKALEELLKNMDTTSHE